MALKTKELPLVSQGVRVRAEAIAELLGASKETMTFTSFSRFDVTAEALATRTPETLEALGATFGAWCESLRPAGRDGASEPDGVRKDLDSLSEQKELGARECLVSAVCESIPFLVEKFGDDEGKYARLLKALSGSLPAIDDLAPFERREAIRLLALNGENAFGPYLAACELRKQPSAKWNGKAGEKRTKKSSGEWYPDEKNE